MLLDRAQESLRRVLLDAKLTEEDRVEMALAGRAAQIFERAGLYIVCAVLDQAAR